MSTTLHFYNTCNYNMHKHFWNHYNNMTYMYIRTRHEKTTITLNKLRGSVLSS